MKKLMSFAVMMLSAMTARAQQELGKFSVAQLITLLFILSAVPSVAQQIRTIDKDGQPIPYVSVLTTDAKYIGITDLDGILKDVKGADTIAVSHVAYKSKLYKVNGKSGSIILEDADFGLPEIVVKKKPYVYAQTYYRIFYYDDSLGVVYYRVGLTDNVIDCKTKKLSANTRNASKAKYGILKTVLNALVGSKLNKRSELPMKKIEESLKKSYEANKVKITDEGPGKKRISDFKGTVGYITDNQSTGQRRYSVNMSKLYNDKLEATGKTKELAKREKKDAKKKNEQDNDYFVFRIDENGNYSPEDFMMMQYLTSFDKTEKDGRNVHVVMAFQVFTIDRAYVDKNELKALKKDNKIKMNYQNIRQFEQAHKIPALAPAIQKKLNELWKADEE
jgi:hypothetical protein